MSGPNVRPKVAKVLNRLAHMKIWASFIIFPISPSTCVFSPSAEFGIESPGNPKDSSKENKYLHIFANHNFGGFDDGDNVVTCFEAQSLGGGAGDGRGDLLPIG